MFCPNCGKEDLENSKYCMYCGAEMIDNQNFGGAAEQLSRAAQALAPMARAFAHKARALAPKARAFAHKALALLAEAWRFLTAHKKVAVPVCAALLALAVLTALLGSLFSPERIARGYFQAVMEADAGKAYGCVDVADTPFTRRDDFEAFWRDAYSKQDVYNYTVEELGAADGGAMERTYCISYYLRGDSQPHSMDVTVVKDSRKEFLLFDRYRVLPNFLAVNYEIAVPSGSTVTLNGEALVDPDTWGGAQVYRLPALFQKPYELSVSHPLGGALTETVYPVSGDVYSCGGLVYSEQTRGAVYEQAVGQLKTILACALADQETMGDIALASDGDASEQYALLRGDLVNVAEGTGFYKFELTETADESYEQQFSADGMYYECSLSFRYDYGRLYKRGDAVESEERSSSGGAVLWYAYEDGQWKLAQLNVYY